MSIDCMNEVLAALVTASSDRKAAALRVLRGEDLGLVRRVDAEPFLTLREVGRQLAVSPCSLWRWGVPGHELGGRRRFRMTEVQAYLASDAFKQRAAELREDDRARRARRARKSNC